MAKLSYTPGSLDRALALLTGRGVLAGWRHGTLADDRWSATRRVVYPGQTTTAGWITNGSAFEREPFELRSDREAYVFVRGAVTADEIARDEQLRAPATL